jgi:hypothetical protein
MTHTKDEALKLAYEALEFDGFYGTQKQRAITAIKQALAAPVQEPVAWMFDCGNGGRMYAEDLDASVGWLPLYTTPPAAQPAQAQGPYSAPVKELWSVAPKAAAQPAQQEPVALLNGIKRYEPEIFREDRIRMELDQSGEWVKYADVELLIATPPAATMVQLCKVAFRVKREAIEICKQQGHLEAAHAIQGLLSVNAHLDPATPPAAQPAPEQYTALEQALTRLQKRYAELEAKAAAQPAVPDAITDDSESLEYRTGWNDCRAEMLKGMK